MISRTLSLSAVGAAPGPPPASPNPRNFRMDTSPSSPSSLPALAARLRLRLRGPAFGVLRQVVGDRVPGGHRVDPLAELRADAGVAVERAETDGDLGASGIAAAEQARAADAAESLDHGVGRRLEDPHQVLARHDAQLLRKDAPLGRGPRPRMLAAARAVAVAGAQKRPADFEADPPAQPGAGQDLLVSGWRHRPFLRAAGAMRP